MTRLTRPVPSHPAHARSTPSQTAGARGRPGGRWHVPSFVYGCVVGSSVILYVDHVVRPALNAPPPHGAPGPTLAIAVAHPPPGREPPALDTVTRSAIVDTPRENGNNDDAAPVDDGWHAIHVYYGNRSTLLYPFVPPPSPPNSTTHDLTAATESTDHDVDEDSPPVLRFDAAAPLAVVNHAQPWYAQAHQDEVVATLLGRDGYFVDVAANDARLYSNTLALETRFHWTGLCVEPNPTYWYGLAHRRCTVVAALLGGDGDANEEDPRRPVPVQFRGVFGGVVSKMNTYLADVKHEPPAPTEYRYMVSLREVLARHHAPSVIDYLSLDVEGMEFAIMEHFPWDVYHIKVMTVERPRTRLRKLLKERGYILVKHLAVQWGETLWVHHSTGWTAEDDVIQKLPSIG